MKLPNSPNSPEAQWERTKRAIFKWTLAFFGVVLLLSILNPNSGKVAPNSASGGMPSHTRTMVETAKSVCARDIHRIGGLDSVSGPWGDAYGDPPRTSIVVQWHDVEYNGHSGIVECITLPGNPESVVGIIWTYPPTGREVRLR